MYVICLDVNSTIIFIDMHDNCIASNKREQTDWMIKLSHMVLLQRILHILKFVIN